VDIHGRSDEGDDLNFELSVRLVLVAPLVPLVPFTNPNSFLCGMVLDLLALSFHHFHRFLIDLSFIDVSNDIHPSSVMCVF